MLDTIAIDSQAEHFHGFLIIDPERALLTLSGRYETRSFLLAELVLRGTLLITKP